MSRPRIRSLKPEAWQDERIGALSRDARLLFVGLITMADDEGRLRAQPAMIIGHVYPWDEITLKQLAAWLAEIEAQRLIERYEIDGRPYIALRNWKRHQRINRPTPSELPAPSSEVAAANSAANSVNDHGEAPVNSSAPLTPSRARGSEGIGSGSDQDQDPPKPPGEGEDLSGPLAAVMAVFAEDPPIIAPEAGVVNAIRAYPGADHVMAARDVRSWVTNGTGMTIRNPGGALMNALGKQTARPTSPPWAKPAAKDGDPDRFSKYDKAVKRTEAA